MRRAYEPGMRVSLVARNEGVSASLLFQWRKLERQGALTAVQASDDLITAKLPALQAYQLSLAAPPPPTGSFDAVAAARGKLVFKGAGKCATSYTGDKFTDATARLHRSVDASSPLLASATT